MDNSSTTADGVITKTMGMPTNLEILLPPFLLIILIFIGSLILSCITQPGWWSDLCFCKSHNSKPDKNVVADSSTEKNTGDSGASYHESHTFLTSNDLAVLHKFQIHFNRPKPLLVILLPSVLTLGFCPATLFMRSVMVNGFWPPDIFAMPPNINDSISSFLVPAGLVYAIAFGFAFQEAISKSSKVVSIVEEHMVCLEQISQLTKLIKLLNHEQRCSIFHTLKQETIQWMLQIMGRRQTHLTDTGLWRVINVLQEVGHHQKDAEGLMDTHLLDEMVSKVVQLQSLLSDKTGMKLSKINPFLWIFLEILSFFSFFGILLLRAQSYRYELTICVITVISITVFSYVLADMDEPFHGFFRVPLGAFVDYVYSLENESQYYVEVSNDKGIMPLIVETK